MADNDTNPQNERPIERALRRAARERRAQAGGPFELHPVNRRLLQEEVAKQFGKSASRSGWLSGLSFTWPRLAWAVAVAVVLGVSLLLLPDRNNQLSSAQEHQKLALGRPADRRMPSDAPVHGVEPTAVPERPAPPAPVPGAPAVAAPILREALAANKPAPAEEAAPALGIRDEAKQSPNGAVASARRGQPARESEKAGSLALSDSVVAYKADRSLQRLDATVSESQESRGSLAKGVPQSGSNWLLIANFQSQPAPLIGAGTSSSPSASRSQLAGAETSSSPSASRSQLAGAETSSSSSASGPQPPGAGTSSSPLASGSQLAGAETSSSPLASGPQPPGAGTSSSPLAKPASKSTVAVAEPQSRYTTGAADSLKVAGTSTTINARNKEPINSRDQALAAASANPSASAGAQSSTTPAAAPVATSGATVLSGSIVPAPPTNLLTNFKVEQGGNQIRVTDADGSVYMGEIQVTPADFEAGSGTNNIASRNRAYSYFDKDQTVASEREDVAKAEAPMTFGGGGGFGGRGNAPQAPTELLQRQLQNQSQNQAQISQQQNAFFRVSGTNRSLNRRVEFTGNLLNVQAVDPAAANQGVTNISQDLNHSNAVQNSATQNRLLQNNSQQALRQVIGNATVEGSTQIPINAFETK